MYGFLLRRVLLQASDLSDLEDLQLLRSLCTDRHLTIPIDTLFFHPVIE